MTEQKIQQAYELARERYAAIGVDTEKVLGSMQDFHLSMHPPMARISFFT